MKYCQNCGSKCDDTDLICKACGAMLSSIAPENTAEPSPNNSAQAPLDPAKRPYTENVNYRANSYTQNTQAGNNPYSGSGTAPNYYGSNPNTYYTQPSPYSNYNAVPKTNGLAIASMVLGIVGLLFLWCYGFGLLPAILAVIFGCISRSSIKNSQGTESGNGMAIAGLVLGIVTIAIFIIIVVLAICGLMALGVFTGNGLGTSSGRTFNT